MQEVKKIALLIDCEHFSRNTTRTMPQDLNDSGCRDVGPPRRRIAVFELSIMSALR